MQPEKREGGDPIGPLDWLKKVPFKPAASSDGLGWVGLEATRFRAAPDSELNQPAISHHRLFLLTRPPETLDLCYEGVKRHIPLPAGSISLVPAGSPALWRWHGSKDSLHIYLEPELVARVAGEAFGLDPARLTVPPLDGLDLPHLRAAMWAVDAELTAGGVGGVEPVLPEGDGPSFGKLLDLHMNGHGRGPRADRDGASAALRRPRVPADPRRPHRG